MYVQNFFNTDLSTVKKHAGREVTIFPDFFFFFFFFFFYPTCLTSTSNATKDLPDYNLRLKRLNQAKNFAGIQSL